MARPSRDRLTLELAQLWRRALQRPRIAARALGGRGLLRRLQVDSMALLELVALIEERYQISLVDQELRRADFDSIAALAQAVRRRMGAH